MNLALPGIAGLGWPELIIIVLVVLLLFGGKKLPEMARGTGRALRIFKAETKGLMDDDDDDKPVTDTQAQLPQAPVVQPQPVQQQWPIQQPVQGQPPVQQQWTDQQPAQPQWVQQPVQPAPVDEPPRSDTPR
jgi:sec-independent protein translocase protein TatA